MVLRETADGWIDLDGSRFQQSGGRDLPDMTPNTRAILVDGDGSGHLLGGVSDTSTTPVYRGGPDAPTLGGVASVRRLERGALAPSPSPTSQTAETPAPPGSVRLAVGGHPACLDRCSGAGGQGYAPDTHLHSALARVRAMAAGGAGPAALLIGGGRASLGGEPLDPAGARRYRELTQGAGVPTYVLPGPGDLPNGGAEAFASAFATAPAPQGTGAAPAGVDLLTVTQPEAAVAGQARSTFAFDIQASAGTVRVIAIDNAAGRLAGGPDGAQARWIRETMEQARLHGVPSIVVGSMPLDDSQNAKPAEDAADEIALLAGHASAYVATAGVDDPADQYFGGVLAQNVVKAPGVDALLTLLQSSTLGYAPSQKFTVDPDDVEAFRQTNAALLMIDVAVGRLDSSTGIAPVEAVSEPLLQGLALDQASRTIPLGWAFPLFVTASDPSPRRFLMSPGPDEPLQPASPGTTSSPLIDQCRFFLQSCATVVPTDTTFTSSDPRIARFVAVRRGGGRRPSRGHPRRLRARRQRSPRLPVPARARVGRRRRDRPRPARHEPGPRDSGLEPRRRHPVGPDPGRHVRVPELRRARRRAEARRHAPTRPPPPRRRRPIPLRRRPNRSLSPSPSRRSRSNRCPRRRCRRRRPCPRRSRRSRPSAPPAADPARPPVAPAPKPPVAPAPPTPPQGLQIQAGDAPQVQPSQAMQHAEQRRQEYAFEADSAAVAYAHPPSPLPWEIAGGIAVLALVMAGGGLAGRSRSRAVAVARSSAGT